MPQVGQAWITVVPSLRGFNQRVRQQLQRELQGVEAKVKVQPDLQGAKQDAQRKGQEAAGEFAQSFRRRVEAALKALPDVKIGADSTRAQREIARIRRELQALSEKTVGVDIDAAQATAKINQLRQRLARLGAEHTSIDLDVDIGAAQAQLSAIDRQVSRLDGRRAKVAVDVDQGNAQRASYFLTQQVNGLVLAGAGIAPVFVPAFAAAAAGALGLASAVAGAGAGVGALVAVAVPAFSAVSDAVKAAEQQEKAAATSVVNTTRQRTQAAFQAQQAAERVADAQWQADRTSVEGARRVQEAQRALAETRRDVADRVDDANERVSESERRLEQAHEAVQRAQEDLTEARREAIRVLEDLREESSDLALSEEGAEIALERARQRLAETNRDATATLLDRREATYEVAQAEDRLSDVQRDRRRTRQELNEAERAGVNGSELVIDAEDRLTDATESVAEAQRATSEAQRDLVRAQQDGARQIAEAERSVSDARQQAAQANADAARAVADAMQAQVQQAELARLEAENGIAANRNLAFALGQLTPMQRELYDGWLRLRDAFREWARALEPAVLPLFVRGMGLIQRALPLFTPLVLAAAGAFDYLLDRASATLGSPFWKSFVDFLAGQASGAIVTFGLALGDIARGLAGMLMAFGVFSGDLNRGLVELTERFADWGEGLADNPGFHRFVDFVREVWPPLKDTILAVADAFGAIALALAPIGGGPVLTVLRGIADWIAGMDPSTIQAIAFALGGIALAVKLIGIAMAIGTIGPWGLAILAVAGAIAFAYFKFEGFRDVVQSVVDWFRDEAIPRIQDFGDHIVRVFEDHIRPALEDFGAWFQEEVVPVLEWIGETVVRKFGELVDWFDRNWPRIQDAIGGFVDYVEWKWNNVFFPLLRAAWFLVSQVLGPVLLWLWHNVVEPAFKGIAAAIAFAWHYIVHPVLEALRWFIENVVAPVISWLWHNVIQPAFNGIGAAISFAWNYVILPVFRAIDWVIRNLLWPVFSWLWHNVIEPVWRGIRETIRAAWAFIRDKIFEPMRNFLRDKVRPAFGAVRDTVANIWEQIRKTAKSMWDRITDVIRNAVNLAIRIINKIGDAIESVARAIGIDISIRNIPELRESRPRAHTNPLNPGMAGVARRESGGLVPYDLGRAGPFVTNGPRAIVGEGSPSHPEFVIPTDPKFRGRALGLFQQLGTQLMASGGIARPRGPGIAGLYDPLAAAVADVIRQARGDVTISSGWRSNAQQAALYHRYRTGRGNLAARPGSSKHEAGAAVDFGGNRSLYTRLARAEGLVAPVRGEPWHWEYPGQGGGGGGGGFSVTDAVQKIVDAARGISDLGGKLFGLPRKALGWLKDRAVDWAKDKVEDFLSAPFRAARGVYRSLTQGGVGFANSIIGRGMAADRGWTGHQWEALNNLVMSESAWNHMAQNPASTAYGIGQFLDSTWATVGARKTSDPVGQISAMYDYIAQRYDNPARAWAFKQANNWYEAGGVLPFLGSYQTGVDRVPHDGLAFLHRDEAVLDASDAQMFRMAALNSQKGGRTFEQTNQFYGITDYGEIARRTGDEMAWQVTVGSH